MTRQKKSRNAGNNGQRHLPASEIRKTRETKEETKKKGSGLKSGTRNSMQQSKDAQAEANKAKKDPRIGSKKPIALIAEPTLVEQMPNVVSAIPKAQLKAVKAETLTPEQELASIEADERLQALLERVEQDEVLTGKDAKYFNSKTARLSELLQLLGLDDADDEATRSDSADEEEDPLARFERTDWRKTLLGDED
ncbi:Der GTPase-activating protein YihI [Alishewanella sp. SMS8]|uniref:Der GTPase-activating protein YihI n=1 Tax=unclassified Alishewanella TaxID=2628974 RepID=UPI002740A1C6|nr:Der GTPase-activating protein YihI [Alishewanella sp. SMS8]MDP4945194.1 Der GTPase-activating protein YihI [Alishewanella sp.]MDP5207380.1 Der GTPase-activating protein YihI [Alishewanella sp. SMS9]MDP5036569.1 Der GTPase-activating protein YihI [Alishewanella sp.]MDP5187782.1 Der GTPase-activating protein YihI [Alishewanella sp.]MDP5459133.1 Der GTPase-activating protein YihI [Alishewanella sp. SMS8]